MLRRARRYFKINSQSDKESLHDYYVRLIRRYPPEQFPEQFRRIQENYNDLILAEDSLKRIWTKFAAAGSRYHQASQILGDHIDLSAFAGPENLDFLLTDPGIWAENQPLAARLAGMKIVYRKPPE
ncbi:MAG: hypothetical protein LBK52_00815 [Deltaproteobacteria bacterium]|jgi:hypothetical protein|nr:hypothetical protein [Deltaproteobacteria bacterium]